MKFETALTPAYLLRRFATEPSPDEDTTERVRRTFAVSETSREHCAHLLPLFEGDTTPRFRDLYLAHSRHQAGRCWEQLEELFGKTPEAALRRVWELPAPLRWGLVETLSEVSRKLAATNRPLALLVAQATIQLAEEAPVQPLPPEARLELQALAHATVANAYRAQDRTSDAENFMEEAQRLLDKAPGNCLGILSQTLAFKAALQVWKHRHLKARLTLDLALEAASNASGLLRARLHIQRSSLANFLEDHVASAQDLESAEALLDPEVEPHLWACCRLNRIVLATQRQKWQEAAALLPEARERMAQLGDQAHLLCLTWSEARLERGQGDEARTEALYREAREGFLHLKLAFRAAVVTLELARLLFEQGRLEQVKQYALETAAEFRRQGVEPELVGALVLLEKAVVAQRLTVKLLERITRSVERRARP